MYNNVEKKEMRIQKKGLYVMKTKDVVLDEVRKKTKITNFIQSRILENQKLFTYEELDLINKNKNCVKKLYLLGFLDSKNCYER